MWKLTEKLSTELIVFDKRNLIENEKVCMVCL